jgi:uroporphyrinogen decarboxylase
MNSRDRFLAALHRRPHGRPPVWIMRQAGRYLPEYRKLKAQSDFVTMVRTPDLAVEVTLQPLRRFAQLDAAILFSDILVIPEALGVGYRFRDEGGIAMEKSLQTEKDLSLLQPAGAIERLDYVYKALRLLRKELGTNKALLGFAGSPWTLACYLVEGGGSEEFPKMKSLVKSNPKFVHQILNVLTQTVAGYLKEQLLAGADAIQIFDSWAGVLEGKEYEEFSLRYIREVIALLPPQAPIILYAKGKSADAGTLAKTGVPCLGVDWTMPISTVRALVDRPLCIQGNLNPEFIVGKPDAAIQATQQILKDNAGDLGHIFNLGHGITPDAQIDTLAAVLDTVVHSGV